MLLHNRATRCNNTDGAQWHEHERSTKTQTHTRYYDPNKQGKHASASVSASARPAPESHVRRAAWQRTSEAPCASCRCAAVRTCRVLSAHKRSHITTHVNRPPSRAALPPESTSCHPPLHWRFHLAASLRRAHGANSNPRKRDSRHPFPLNKPRGYSR